MTELTDRLMKAHLMGDPERRSVYHYDAQHHAELVMFSRALDWAHKALMSTGSTDADRIVEILSLGLPDAEAGRARIGEAQREAMKLGGWGVRP